MNRTTHTLRQRSLRITQKVQRGGVRLNNWPDLGTRMNEWKNTLATSALATDLGKLFEPKDEAQNHKPEHLELWFRVLERQDELFDIALSIMSKKIGIDGSGSNIIEKDSTVAETKRAELVQYLFDVEKMVSFVHDDGTNGVTKLSQISKNTLEPFLSLFLFPKRIHNMFIESLANIFVALKDDSHMLTHIQKPFLLTILAAQYRSYILSNIMTMTGMIQRDAYYLNCPSTQISNDFVANISDTFYASMLTEIALGLNTSYEDLFSNTTGCKYYIDEWKWPKLAAHIFLAYKKGSLKDILKRFNTKCTSQPSRRPRLEKKYYPDKYEDIMVRDVNFGALLSNMSYLKLEFILQLCYKIEQASLQETAAPTV